MLLWSWPPINRAVKVALFFVIALELLTTNLVQDTKFLEPNYVATHGHADGGLVKNHVLNCTSNDILPNGWCMEEESQTPRYFLDTDNSSNKENHATAVSGDSLSSSSPIVTIQHYTHKGYEMCLANKTIVFIGDSRVRYQYMNLAHFLMSPLSRFMRCDDHPTCKKGLTHPDKDCYLIGDGRGGRGVPWKDWCKNSTNSLSSNNMVHLCDCYRHTPLRPKLNLTFENRFIKRYTQYGEINLIYLQSFVDKITMNEDYPPFSSFLPDGTNTTRCGVGECNANKRKISFTGTVNDTLWNILPQLNTTHAFVSFGWTEIDDENQTKQSELACALNEFSKHHPNIKTYQMTTPPHTESISNTTAFFNAAKMKCNCNVFDRTTMNENVPLDWYWDNVHVLGIINEEYNHRLIESICPM